MAFESIEAIRARILLEETKKYLEVKKAEYERKGLIPTLDLVLEDLNQVLEDLHDINN